MIKPRYNLRFALFVITISSLWLGCHVEHVRSRKAFLAEVKAEGWLQGYSNRRDQGVGVVRRLLGDEVVEGMLYPTATAPSRVRRFQKLFPEATLHESDQLPLTP